MKGKETLVLATDEDREGESISWHLLQVLKPGKNVDVRRIAFHRVQRDALHQQAHHAPHVHVVGRVVRRPEFSE